MNQIVKDFGKGFKQLGEETVEKLVENSGMIVEPIITAQELLGDIRPMSDEEMTRKRAEDEAKKQEEIDKLKHGGEQGRNVEDEMEKIRRQNEKEDEEREKYFEQMKEQQEKEQQVQMIDYDLVASKHPKNKGGNPHKKQQPDQSQMSQTAEFKVKPN